MTIGKVWYDDRQICDVLDVRIHDLSRFPIFAKEDILCLLVALCCESSPSISARTFGSTSSFRYANLVTEESFVLSISAWNLFQNGSHASYVPLNFVICSFGGFVFLCSLWLAFSTGCCFALVYSSWCSNSSFISIFSLSNLSSSSRTRAFLSSSFCLRCWISSFVSNSHFSSREISSSASAIGSSMLLLQFPTSSSLFGPRTWSSQSLV